MRVITHTNTHTETHTQWEREGETGSYTLRQCQNADKMWSGLRAAFRARRACFSSFSFFSCFCFFSFFCCLGLCSRCTISKWHLIHGASGIFDNFAEWVRDRRRERQRERESERGKLGQKVDCRFNAYKCLARAESCQVYVCQCVCECMCVPVSV